MSSQHLQAPSIDPREAAHFESLAHRWWDEQGPFWPLHRLNAFRADYVREKASAALGRHAGSEQPFAGLRVLDVGCGGGILSESVARLGARVQGIDISEKNIHVSRLHAEWSGLDIDYQLTTVEDLAASRAQFDLVLNMEVVEHVEQLPDFLGQCARLVRPGGVMVVATINRTLIAWLTAIIAAERVLRWLPKGTHHFRKLVKPKEVIAGLGPQFRVLERTGVRVNPFNRSFHFTPYMGVNYMMVFERA
ncbi:MULTISPECIES: bifunctional 2-polyprenyl-6-hydroxyphenol methylase/3-demethylubiquinol 3-O-methyltransferase UbiG [Thiorhodovibrio]|uniref:bifunctional 2-polyprenyl-6-hydroxyphenol methylase/3-demethylubiquinol 3-O-methyltransferase UbiG n=1 Tax=Thiorhodovibrio TaxID=61593 RepID=UPI001913258F|nr:MULTISPECIES: bifunctional 2-polyprenyl-6-hydroxyphenol methylase/3-demethylubiquinol 3-O-methyltransferase UbiG [Thiorhodovibrio]MBK5970485.1 bifunctional 3-demethylubiquinol 3-O-methyltransferase/2-polyprenyl-6-hydroxyphenol methylase [Thiorhodovibrio winogradskyi]WPL11486.1 3-demethylubiquinone-9 3-methyltransferase [Thiorhodovibrio litoralis]